MQDWTVEFDPACGIETSDWGEIRDVLLNIPHDSDPSRNDHWPAGLREVRVLRRLAGGRSGSEVIELQLLLDDGDSHLHVAKLSNRKDALKEYKAASSVAKRERFPMHLGIVAASRGVLDDSAESRYGQGRQVIVYQHLEDRHGSSGQTQSLEELITHGALHDTQMESACTALRHVMRDLADQFHRALRADTASLVHLNRTLGTDLLLQFERVKPQDDDEVILDLGISSPRRDEVEAERRSGNDVLMTSSSPPGRRRTIASGQRVTVAIDQPTCSRDKVTGQVGTALVQAEARGLALNRDLKREFDGCERLQVSANVVHTRAELRSQLLKSALSHFGGVKETDEQLICDNVPIAHPLRSLYDVLSRARERRVSSAVHGDLNPRNVLVRDGRTYLIDFAAAEPGGLTLTDYAWLEVCCLRELEKADLTWRDLVRLQRQLAVLSRLSVYLDSDCLDKILGALVDTCLGHLGRCLALLWEVRRAALSLERTHCSPDEAQRHLFEYLTLAALRPLKFPEAEQTPHRVAVCAATAGVAAEALHGGQAALFEAWEPHQVAAFIRALLDSGQAHRPGAVDMLISARGVSWAREDRESEADSDLLRALFDGPLSERVIEQREECQQLFPFISLTGRVLRPGEPFIQQGDGALAMGPSPAIELLWANQRCVVVGDCGAGKTATVRELHARLLRGALEPQHHAEESPPLCWPLELSALRISEYLRPWHTADPEATSTLPALPQPTPAELVRECADLRDIDEGLVVLMLRLGSVFLTVDDLHKVDAGEKPYVLAEISRLSAVYPAARITVCQRSGDYQPDALRWPAIALHKVRPPQAREYIEDRLRQDDQGTWRSRVRVLYQALFRDAEAGSLRDLASKPLFLKIMVDHYLKERTFSTTNPGKLLEEYTRGLIKDADESEIERRMKLLAHLAGDMDELGAAIRYDDAIKSLERLKPPNARETLEALLRTTAIVTDPSRRWVTFDNPVIHAYFAATVLAQDENSAKVADRILQFHWREAAQLLVANPQSPENRGRHILQTALDANLVYGAWLLQAAPPDRFGDLRDQLLHTLTAQLESKDSGQPAWRQAAYGFAKYGTSQAMQTLKATAMRAAEAPAAAEALDGLVMMHQWFVPEAEQVLTEVLSHLLDAQPDHLSEDLTVRAVRSIATLGLHRLVGYVWDQIREDAPWPVIRQAWRALAQMKIRPSRALHEAYTAACRRRLPETLDQLARTADVTTVYELNLEQRDILGVLAEHGDLEVLLQYRFRTGLANDATWHQRLATAAGQCDGSDLADLLNREDTTDWAELLDSQDDNVVLLASHMLLHRGQTLSVERVQQLAAGASPSRLLALAGFVHTLNGHEVPAVDDIVRSYVGRLNDGYLEPLSALVGAVSNHGLEARPRTALLLDEATRAPGAAPSLYWPWATAWRESVPDRSEIDLFVQAPHLDDGEVLKLLSTTDVLLDAPPFDPVPLSEERRNRLQQLQPSDPTSLDAHRFVMLAASTGLHQRLSFVREAARHTDNRSNIVLHSHPLHGVQPIAPAAHAIAAIGYLSLMAAKELAAAGQLAFAAHKELTRMITTVDDAHLSLRRARLVGMGFLGDWMEILEGLEPEDPVMHHAARNIVMHWVPGPCSPHSDEKNHLVDVARWISDRLRQTGIPSPTRAALVQIRDTAETQLGRYVR
ncbi:hypothetical protein [Streptomyces sp. NPDC056628]|uniref:hypothetical protein n=1 Tax=Streptomyces sp. NPDC056628 TaxID=3345882 RepID=UPI003685CA14